MNYTETCPHCGRKVTAYTVQLNRPLVVAFLLFAEARIRHGQPIKKAEINLTHSQYGNFQKLRHFGFVEKRKGQTWEMTSDGWAFLTGRKSVLNPAGQFGNATLSPGHPAWDTHPDPRKWITIRDALPEGWATRLDYVAEKCGMAI